MVRMQSKDNSMEIDTPQRSSLTWDKNKQPYKSILKHNMKYSNNIIRKKQGTENGNKIVIVINVPETNKSSDDINDVLDKMTLSECEKSKLSNDSLVSKDKLQIKASKLYGTTYEMCHQYNVSTSITIRYSLSHERIMRLRKHTGLIQFMDIYNLSSLLKEIIQQQPGTYEEPEYNNDFYCNAYWAVQLTNSIAELVFEKLNIKMEESITYNPCIDLNQTDCEIDEMTHILKHQLSVCEWLTTTIAPNYQNGCIPYQLGPLLVRELQNLLLILTTANDKWIEYAIKVLC